MNIDDVMKSDELKKASQEKAADIFVNFINVANGNMRTLKSMVGSTASNNTTYDVEHAKLTQTEMIDEIDNNVEFYAEYSNDDNGGTKCDIKYRSNKELDQFGIDIFMTEISNVSKLMKYNWGW